MSGDRRRFRTQDLRLAAYLMVLEVPLHRKHRDTRGANYLTFEFDISESQGEEHQRNFDNKGSSARVHPRAYAEEYEHLKTQRYKS